MTSVRVLGLDGMSLPLLRQLISADLMPAAGALLERSESGPLRSTIPFSTIPGWASIFTGVLPGQHGQLWWKKDDPWLPWPIKRDRGFTSFHECARPPLWELLNSLGHETAFFDIPASFPAPATKGMFVAGFLGPWPHPLAVSPAELRTATRDWLESDASIGDSASRPLEELTQAVEALTEATSQRLELYSSTFRESCDLTFQVLVGPDRLSHVSWPHLIPQSRSSAIDQAVASYWRAVDQFFVPLSRGRECGDTVIVCSDHGSTSPPTTRFHLLSWLGEHGYLPAGRSTSSAHAAHELGQGLETLRKKVGPLAARMGLQDLGRQIRDATRDWVWKASRGSVDETRVFGAVLGDHEAAFFINPAETETDSLVDNLIKELEVETHEGAPVFAQVGKAHSFLGPLATSDRVPDVVAVTREEIGVAQGLPGQGVLMPDSNPARGVHQRAGLYLLGGDQQEVAPDPGVEDITPTILELLDVKTPDWMQGRSLLDLSPTKVIGELSKNESEVRQDLSREDEEAIEGHLRGLGYVE